MKKLLALLLCIVMVFSLAACGGSDKSDKKKPSVETEERTTTTTEDLAALEAAKLQGFYDLVKESADLLDVVADSIYRNWYDCIYKDKFYESIDLAIASALVDHKEDVDRIKELDENIAGSFKFVKDGEQGALVKEIMSAYSDYYEFVINVSGSFNSFSASKETLKKELASLLRDLSYEL
jgi:hypothetical protein